MICIQADRAIGLGWCTFKAYFQFCERLSIPSCSFSNWMEWNENIDTGIKFRNVLWVILEIYYILSTSFALVWFFPRRVTVIVASFLSMTELKFVYIYMNKVTQMKIKNFGTNPWHCMINKFLFSQGCCHCMVVCFSQYDRLRHANLRGMYVSSAGKDGEIQQTTPS